MLTEAEAAERRTVFDIDRLARRLVDDIDWVASQPALVDLPIGLFGATTGEATALKAAAAPQVTAPTMLIVGGNDEPVLGWNCDAAQRMGGPVRVTVIPGATHLFEEPGSLVRVTALATDWFAGSL